MKAQDDADTRNTEANRRHYLHFFSSKFLLFRLPKNPLPPRLSAFLLGEVSVRRFYQRDFPGCVWSKGACHPNRANTDGNFINRTIETLNWSLKRLDRASIASFLKPRNLRRPSWWDHFALRHQFCRSIDKTSMARLAARIFLLTVLYVFRFIIFEAQIQSCGA